MCMRAKAARAGAGKMLASLCFTLTQYVVQLLGVTIVASSLYTIFLEVEFHFRLKQCSWNSAE